jgi:transposase
MNRLPVFVGIDYHARSLQVCLDDARGEVLWNGRCRNHPQEVVERVEQLGRSCDVQGVALEVCCGAADFAEKLIEQTGWLADLERVGYLPKVWLAPQVIRELRKLVRYRQQVVDQRRDVKLRIGALLREHRVPSPEFRRWTRAWMTWVQHVPLPEQSRWVMDRHLEDLAALTHKLKQAEDRLEQVTASDSLIDYLLTLPGIGPVTAWMLRAEIGWFHRFRSGKQLARFCGLSPRNASSGERQADAGLIKAGNNQLRAVLLEAAHRLMRHDPRWSRLGRRLLSRGKPWNVVAAAVANRWSRWLYHQTRSFGQAA